MSSPLSEKSRLPSSLTAHKSQRTTDFVLETVAGEKVRGPFFNGPNQFAVHFTFDITRKATNDRTTIEEVGVYTVGKDDKITREQFFYDGEH